MPHRNERAVKRCESNRTVPLCKQCVGDLTSCCGAYKASHFGVARPSTSIIGSLALIMNMPFSPGDRSVSKAHDGFGVTRK